MNAGRGVRFTTAYTIPVFVVGLALPETLFREAHALTLSPARATARFQLGLAVEILLRAPIRMNNLVALRFGEELVRQGGKHGLWHIVLGARLACT